MPNDTEIPAAMTPREWERYLGTGFFTRGVVDNVNATLHATAAIALHGQPYGFTWADVDEIMDTVRMGPSDDQEVMISIANRIAALLPPRE